VEIIGEDIKVLIVQKTLANLSYVTVSLNTYIENIHRRKYTVFIKIFERQTFYE